MRIGIGYLDSGIQYADHIKTFLKQHHHDIVDFGIHDHEGDYPDLAYIAGRAVASAVVERVILICGAGLCSCICANKMKGVYASPCYDPFEARMARSKYNTNVLCLSYAWTDAKTAIAIVAEWLRTPFNESTASVRSLRKIQAIEARQVRPLEKSVSHGIHK